MGLMAGGGQAYADYALNMPVGVTELSRDVHDLHMLILWICVGIGVAVYGVLIYSLIYHRKSRGAVPATFHENTRLEIIWTIIPFLILLGMAIPATKVMLNIYDLDNSREPVAMTVKVTGYQWKWRYEYLDEGIDFFSTLDRKSNEARQLGAKTDLSKVDHYLLNVDKPLVIPVNQKVRFVFTAADVIHSWWVPEFGWKKDAIPGFITDGWVKVEKVGTYRGQCTELCGRDHGFMPIVVEVKSEADYKEWVAAHKGAAKPEAVAAAAGGAAPAASTSSEAPKDAVRDELVAKGKAVYDANCASCHQPNGEGIPGTFPAIKGSAVATGPIMAHVHTVMDGKGKLMPAFENILKPAEIAAVVTYERNALGNSVGDKVQPSEIPVD
jgi:cytochrome c oxidase subunit 2